MTISNGDTLLIKRLVKDPTMLDTESHREFVVVKDPENRYDEQLQKSVIIVTLEPVA